MLWTCVEHMLDAPMHTRVQVGSQSYMQWPNISDGGVVLDADIQDGALAERFLAQHSSHCIFFIAAWSSHETDCDPRQLWCLGPVLWCLDVGARDQTRP